MGSDYDARQAGPHAPKKVAVLGAGTMGGGIATSLLIGGHTVGLFDTRAEALSAAAARAAKRAVEAVAAGKLTTTSDLAEAVAGADFVIEAVPELLELKRDLFASVGALAPDHAVLATNTSELSVTAIAAATQRPASVVGMHWFNPPERMALVEVVRAAQTSEATLAATLALAASCGKETVVVEDRQGFVTTRAVAALLLEGVRMLEEGVAAPKDIDKAVRLGLNHPMGPLELADLIGLDTVLLIADSLKDALGERFLAPQTLRKLVEAGRLGRKSGRGFYEYGG
ncbi:MAG: 3-hydroxyacyl-CoA dehydrogenase family protein [Trueperaceae bacterium]|nr:3-hydroxyacyl-CoA dehydrogenase family protein [Trueperaceae bacterium]